MIDKKYLAVLNECPLFKNMDEETVNKTVSIMSGKIKSYEKGEFLHNDYETLTSFGLVLSGTVAACVDDIDGNRMIMTNVEKGQTFGESLAFLKIKNSPVYVYATSNSSVLWLNPDNLYKNRAEGFNLELLKRFTEIIAIRPLQMNERIQVLSKIKLRDRIITYLSGLANEKGKKVITVPLNREDMANYIGANRTALSRELSSMKKDGIIDFRKNTFYILH